MSKLYNTQADFASIFNELCSFSKKNSVKYLTSHYLGDY